MTRLVSIKAVGIAVFCIATVIAASSQTSTKVPRIVKVVHLKNQTGAIGPITLYTPQKAGLFRVSLFMVATVGNGVFGSVCPSISFTDSIGPGATLGFNFCLGTEAKGDVSSNVGLIESVASADITLGVWNSSQTAGSAYNVDVVIEALPELDEQ